MIMIVNLAMSIETLETKNRFLTVDDVILITKGSYSDNKWQDKKKKNVTYLKIIRHANVPI